MTVERRKRVPLTALGLLLPLSLPSDQQLGSNPGAGADTRTEAISYRLLPPSDISSFK